MELYFAEADAKIEVREREQVAGRCVLSQRPVTNRIKNVLVN